MIRRDFWRRLVAASIGFLFGGRLTPPSLLAADPREKVEREVWQAEPEPLPAPLPVAPVGPPPLCVVPRGWHVNPVIHDEDPKGYAAEHERRHDAPWNYGQLSSFAHLAAEELGYWPRTWGEVAHGWSLWSMWPRPHRRDLAKFNAEQLELAGVRLSDPVPDREWLLEIGTRCHEWCDGDVAFADGMEYELPMSLRGVDRWPEPLKAKFVEIYEDAGAPWGHTETAAFLYIWHRGEEEVRRTARPHRWDGERFVPLEEGGAQ